jgi:hypothetical protein
MQGEPNNCHVSFHQTKPNQTETHHNKDGMSVGS